MPRAGGPRGPGAPRGGGGGHAMGGGAGAKGRAGGAAGRAAGGGPVVLGGGRGGGERGRRREGRGGGGGVEQFAWKPDGTEIAYVAADEPENKKEMEAHNDVLEVGDAGSLTTAAPTPSH